MRFSLETLQLAIKNSSKFKGDYVFYSINATSDGIFLVKDVGSKIQFRQKISDEITNKSSIGVEESLLTMITKIKKDKWIEFHKGEGLVTTEKRKLKFHCEEYVATISDIEENESISLTGKEFTDLMSVAKVAAQDETRPILKGVSFKENECVSLDGYRLSLRRGEFTLKNQYVISTSAISPIVQVIGKKDPDVRIAFNRKHALIEFEDCSVKINLLEGDFISYDSLIPKEFKTKAMLNSKEVKEEISYVEEVKLVDIKAKIKYLSKDKEKNKDEIKRLESDGIVVLCLNDEETVIRDKDNVTSVRVKSKLKGEDLMIAFNPRYMKDALRDVKGNFVIKGTNRTNPCVVTSKDFDGLELILPIRLAR